MRPVRGAVTVALIAVTCCLQSGAARADPLTVGVVQTNPLGNQWLVTEPNIEMTSTPPGKGTPLVAVQDGTRYQQVTGFGAAMTDSSAWLIERQLSPATKRAVMTDLFGSAELHLSWIRLPIGASDFTVAGTPYTYDDMPPGRSDPTLAHFSIGHDLAYTVPALRLARSINPQVKVLATPWTPPAWMKNNDALSNTGNLGTLRASDYGVWARYLVRFVQAYDAAKVPIAALTPQNEPGNPTRYPGTNLSAGTEAALISRQLAPALAQAKLRPQLFGPDLGWDSLTYARQLATSTAAKDLTGISWHCYYGSPEVMSTVHATRASLQEIVSECSPGISAIPISEVVISSLRNWAGSVMLWNLALEPSGGPVQQPNTGCPGCSGLATINPATGHVAYTSAYYELAQASAFIEPGAHRVASNTFDSYAYMKPGVNFISPGIDDVAFVNPDGSRILLAYNNGDQPTRFAVGWDGKYFSDTLPAGTTATFRWDTPSPYSAVR